MLECEVTDDRLTMVLTSDAAAALDLPPEASFVLDVDAQQVDVLRRGLGRVLNSGRPDVIPRRLAL